jgi:hypothetical protein
MALLDLLTADYCVNAGMKPRSFMDEDEKALLAMLALISASWDDYPGEFLAILADTCRNVARLVERSASAPSTLTAAESEGIIFDLGIEYGSVTQQVAAVLIERGIIYRCDDEQCHGGFVIYHIACEYDATELGERDSAALVTAHIDEAKATLGETAGARETSA